MRETSITIPELGLLAATRVLLGLGLGFLLSGKLARDRRMTAGSVLTAVGALSTIPFVIRAVRRHA
jgi:hypothetical protein